MQEAIECLGFVIAAHGNQIPLGITFSTTRHFKRNCNPLAHAILRGWSDANENAHPNFDFDTLTRLSDIYSSSNLSNPALIIDTNHSNSGKDFLKQGDIAKDVLKSAAKSADIKRLLKGFMIESYLKDGCQQPGGSNYGQSITDPCLGWEKTEKLILELAELW